jgi:hypothetical protein
MEERLNAEVNLRHEAVDMVNKLHEMVSDQDALLDKHGEMITRVVFLLTSMMERVERLEKENAVLKAGLKNVSEIARGMADEILDLDIDDSEDES